MVSINKLSRDLGVSRAAIRKRIASGMPTTTIEAAAAWSRRNLDVTRGARMPPRGLGAGSSGRFTEPQQLERDAYANWRGHRLPFLRYLATLTDEELTTAPANREVWEALLEDFVTSDGAWPKVIAHVLALAEDAEAQAAQPDGGPA